MNLLYYTIGNNPYYIELLKLHLSSLQHAEYSGDIAFITCFKHLIEPIVSALNNNIIYINYNEKSNLFDSSALKLAIYKYTNTSKYSKILYCDVDTLWLKKVDNIFNCIKQNDKIYVSTEANCHSPGIYMNHPFWGGHNILTSEEEEYIINNKIHGFNAGVFGFTGTSVNLIEDIYNICYSNKDKGGTCLEQPFLNTYLLRNSKYDTSLTPEIDHNGYTTERCNKTLLHFPGTPGNFNTKYERMLNYWINFTSSLNHL